MRSLPRKLKLLIIDDELKRSYRGYHVPASIEVLKLDDNLPGIDSWQAALQFWTTFDYDEVPDLVLADVRFIEDRTSPLSLLFKPNENYIPTGLSHLKAFAALARALGKPIGVCARTIDAELWQEQLSSNRPENRAMGYLAMHEIGELAAILGDGKAILGDTDDKQQHIENCRAWLRQNSETAFEEGLRKAVRDYRRSLFKLLTRAERLSIFIRPPHYAELMGWCERMRHEPQPLDSEQDIGLELTYHNGQRDTLSLASLFADYDKITDKALDHASFATDGPLLSEPWVLDDDARPRIGGYLRQLGSLNEACDAAAQAVGIYEASFPLPENYVPKTLAALKTDYGYSDLTLGLIVLFQFVRIEQHKVEQWEDSFVHDSWDAKNLRFISSADREPSDSLLRTLQKLVNVIRKLEPELDDHRFTRFFLFDDFPNDWITKIDVDRGEHDSTWVKWHFKRLVEAGILDCKIESGEEHYKLNSAWRKSTHALSDPTPAPRRFPKVVPRSTNGQRLPKDANRVQQLKLSLGYAKDDFNSVERVLADAFGGLSGRKSTGNERVKVGRAILNNFEGPTLPFFLQDLCRQFATRYREWLPEKWPVWMHRSN